MNPQQDALFDSAGHPLSSADADADRRDQADRRREPTSPWAALPPAGQRMTCRRADEERQPYYVDRFSAAMWAGVLMLVAASLIDAWLTLHVLSAGGVEVNPVMHRLLDHSIEAFLVGKYLLTVLGLPVLLIFKNHYLFGTRIRVGFLIPLAVALYALVIGYQIALIDDTIGW